MKDNGNILVTEGRYGNIKKYGTPKEIMKELTKNMLGTIMDERRVVKLQTKWNETKKNGCTVEITDWDPYTCQGIHFPVTELRYWPYNPFVMKWERVSSSTLEEPNDQNSSESILKTFRSKEVAHAYDTLLDIVLQSGVGNCLSIRHLESDWASQILYWKLRSNPEVTKIEFYIEDSSKKGKQRVLNLCTKLLSDRLGSSMLKEVFVENIEGMDFCSIERFFNSLESNTNLQKLDLQHSRYMHSWQKDYRRRRRTETKDLSISSLVSALVKASSRTSERKKKQRLRSLDLSGNSLSTGSVLELASALPNLSLEKLILRDTCLDEIALLALVRALKDDTQLTELNLSQNTFTMKVTEELIKSLKFRSKHRTFATMSLTLVLEHCDLNFEMAAYFAASLNDIDGLRHLYLNGNEFTFPYPPEGVRLFADAMESGQNTALLTLEMGTNRTECGRSCCTSPYYVLLLEDQERMESRLDNNRAIYLKFRRNKRQQAVINIVTILLEKIKLSETS